MRREMTWLRLVLAAGAVMVVVLTARNVPAGFYVEPEHTSVEIDGINYGTFNEVTGLELGAAKSNSSDKNGTGYLWARNMSKQRQGPKDVHLVKRNDAGEVLSRYVLKQSQPLAWGFEDTTLGGFHETVDLAVQDVEIR
jgi:hypothetical protein